MYMGLEISSREPYEISQRFRLILMQRVRELEAAADEDERKAESLSNPDHARRHRKLVAAQRNDAARLINFLVNSRLRQVV
jgi:hypothetical protein